MKTFNHSAMKHFHFKPHDLVRRCVPWRARRTTVGVLVAVGVAAGVVGVGQVSAAGTTTVVAVSGDPAPDGNGSFSDLFAPVLNDAGQVALRALFTGTSGGASDDEGIVRGDGSTLTQIARTGQNAPDGNGAFSSLFPPVLNNTGQAAFFARLDGTSGGSSDNAGIFSGTGSTLTQIARTGQAAPDGNGSFFDLGSFLIAFNNAGETAFSARLDGTSGGTSDDRGIFRGDGSTLTQIARTGQTAPDGNGSLGNFSTPAPTFNDAGQAAFYSYVTGTSGPIDTRGIFRGDGSTLTQIVRTGQAAPDGNGSFISVSIFPPALNNAGQVAFSAGLLGTSGGFSDYKGMFLFDDTLGLLQVIREGQAAPDGNGSFDGFSTPALNDVGQMAFFARLTGTSGGTSDDEGIFFKDDSMLTQIARLGQVAPDGNGSFANFSSRAPLLNDAGQAAFYAELAGTSGGSSDDRGIFFFDDTLGLLQIAREGDLFLGSTITGLTLARLTFGGKFIGLNNLGQVAYQFDLADGRSGVAIWTVPEPGSAMLAMIGLVGLMVKRRRRPTRG